MTRLRRSIVVLGALALLPASAIPSAAKPAGDGHHHPRLIPRPAGERIPSSARTLEVTVRRPGRPPATDVTVTRATKVRRIASLIDGLQTEQPGAYDCTGRADDPVVTFTFRASPEGQVLARATQIVQPSARGGFCEPMTFTVKGRPQTPLLRGATVVRAAERLLGIRVPRR